MGKKDTRKKQLGRLRSRWLDNILLYPEKIDLGSVDWIGLAQDR
jgi:hypothetical protein